MKKYLLLVLLFHHFSSFGQIDITFPIEKSVFQRGLNNTAQLEIAGNYTSQIDKIEAKLTPVNGGTLINWTTIQINPEGGIYKGSLTVTGGWYSLEVRGSFNGQVVSTTTLSRVGIGEVFLIAGQSNAQGLDNRIDVAAIDDRVLGVNNYNIALQNDFSVPPLPVFQKILANSKLSPAGLSPMYWGSLGDLLVQRLGVPVLFFNAAAGGQPSFTWALTAEGIEVSSPWNNSVFQGKTPYSRFQVALQYYINTYGIRAILWQQGESDTYFKTTKANYINNIKTVINKSRDNLGKNIPWVLSRTSYDYEVTSNSILEAQNEIIATTPNTFVGPNTDNVQIPRPDGVHFEGAATFQELANLWNNHLDQTFFNNAIPIPGSPLINLRVACNSNNISTPLSYTPQEDYNSFSWSNGTTAKTISIGVNNEAYLKAKDINGNVFFSPIIKIRSANIISSKPIISSNVPTPFCSGTSAQLSSNYSHNNIWNSGATSSSLIIVTGGTYSVTHKNLYGCTSTSDPILVNQEITPSKPITNLSGNLISCTATPLTLKASGGSRYLWSTGQQTDSITVLNTSKFVVRSLSTNGCKSLPSDSIFVELRNSPAKPTITANTSTVICDGKSIILTSSNSDAKSYSWSNGANTQNITVNRTGEFSVRTVGVNTCLSLPSSSIITQVVPLPPAPTITAAGPTNFCRGENVELKHNATLPIIWSIGVTTPTIKAIESGSYTAQTIDERSCISIPSNIINVVVRPNPAKPSIEKIGTFTLQVSPSPTDQLFEWRYGQTNLPSKLPVIKANSYGIYTVRASKKYVRPEGEFNCLSEFSDVFDFNFDSGGDLGLGIYPNPSNGGLITIETQRDVQNAKIYIYSEVGEEKFVTSVNSFADRKTLDLSSFGKGRYILRVKSADFDVAKRILLE